MLLTVDEVSELVKLKRATIYKFVAAGRFPKPLVIGPKARRWKREAIEEWVASLSETAGSQG